MASRCKKMSFLWTWKNSLWLNQSHRIHGTCTVYLPAFGLHSVVVGILTLMCLWCSFHLRLQHVDPAFHIRYMHRFFHVCSVSAPQMFFCCKYLKNPLFCALSPSKTSVFNVGVFKQKTPAFKDMSQGSQVPIPEEANALQSFMQNNVARNAVKHVSESGRWVGKLLITLKQENNENC